MSYKENLTEKSFKSQTGNYKIQFDLNNNLLVFLNRQLHSKSLIYLKEQLKRLLSNKRINEIIFIEPTLSKIQFNSDLNQKTLTEYISNLADFKDRNKFQNLLKIRKLDNNSVQLSLFNEIIPEKINTLQYRGNKTQIIDFLRPFFKNGKSILDLMAGSQSVSLALKKHFQIICNDVQYFSYVLGKAYIENNKYVKLKIIPKEIIQPNSNFNLFQTCFSDVYFTKDQCREIDNLRATLEEIRKFDELLYFCYLACLLQCLDLVARTAGHFDGALNNNLRKARNRERKSIYEEFTKKVSNFRTIKSKFINTSFNLPADKLVKRIDDVDIIYIDPPYNHRQYSRYYHILETCAKYDKNINLKTKGLYPLDEFKSNFCYKNKVEQAFRNILELSLKKAKKKILISYSNIGILDRDILLNICKEFSKNVKIFERKIHYTRQKTSNSKKKEKELLFLIDIIQF